MKTTDLIPIILYQLVDGDKYGYEIVKQIEDSSNGAIIIKQPTLYSVLKKLEQGRFISSYWQDSEIGGKRHYYKLTDNGRAQLDTYPAFDVLIKDANAISDDNVSNISPKPLNTIDEPITTSNSINDIVEQEENSVNNAPNTNVIMTEDNTTNQLDNMVEKTSFVVEEYNDIDEIKPIKIDLTTATNLSTDESVSPTIEVDTVLNNVNVEVEEIAPTSTRSSFSIFDAMDYNNEPAETVNSVTENTANTNNVIQDVKTDCNTYQNSDETPKFTDKVETVVTQDEPVKLYKQLTPNQELAKQVENIEINTEVSPIPSIAEVKFLSYVNLENNKESLKRKKAVTKHIQKMSLTCVTLLIAFVVSLVCCAKYSYSKLYYALAIVVCLIIVFYPITLLLNTSKMRLKYCTKPFKYVASRDFLIKSLIFISIIIATFAYNLSVVNSVANIFKLSNFANFYAPILFASVLPLDFVYNTLIYKKY